MGKFLAPYCAGEACLFPCLKDCHLTKFTKLPKEVLGITLLNKRFLENALENYGRIFYHLAVAALSAAIALSLPAIVAFIAKNILVYWAMISNEKIFLVSVEMVFGTLLILLLNLIRRNWRDRKTSRMAKTAGLIFVSPPKGFFARRRIRRLKERQGLARDVMFIGSTGFRTFADPQGDLHQVILNCREAKIMLLHPYSAGASIRARSLLDPGITLEAFAEQVLKSIDFLKGLKAGQKDLKLKLYDDAPLLKLAILGDYIWLQHYHAGLNVESMPEYVFKHDQNTGSLYIPFYQYFLTRWNSPSIAEYDLETDELIGRDPVGNEFRRKFEETLPSADFPRIIEGSLPTGSTEGMEDRGPSKIRRGRGNRMIEDNITST